MEVPDLTSMFDQAEAGARNLAGLLAAYHAHLVSAGLTRDEALVLVVDYQMHVLTAGKRD